jgi:hypothetical protein
MRLMFNRFTAVTFRQCILTLEAKGTQQCRIFDGAGQADEQVNISTLNGIVEPRTEQTHNGTLASFFADDSADRVGLFSC